LTGDAESDEHVSGLDRIGAGNIEPRDLTSASSNEHRNHKHG
jgi:hypothetical protein